MNEAIDVEVWPAQIPCDAELAGLGVVLHGVGHDVWSGVPPLDGAALLVDACPKTGLEVTVLLNKLHGGLWEDLEGVFAEEALCLVSTLLGQVLQLCEDMHGGGDTL